MLLTIPLDKTALLKVSSAVPPDKTKKQLASSKGVRFSDSSDEDNQSNESSISDLSKKFIPISDSNNEDFQVEKLEDKMNLNKCASVFSVKNGVTIKCKILVRKHDEIKESEIKSDKKLSLNPLKLLSAKKLLSFNFSRSNELPFRPLNKPLGVAYIIWTNDMWKTWETIPAKLIDQSYNYLIFEGELLAANEHVKIGKTIECVACYKVDSEIFKDTNDEKCYRFKCIANERSSRI